MNKWDLASVNFTPDKTVVKVTNTLILKLLRIKWRKQSE